MLLQKKLLYTSGAARRPCERARQGEIADLVRFEVKRIPPSLNASIPQYGSMDCEHIKYKSDCLRDMKYRLHMTLA